MRLINLIMLMAQQVYSVVASYTAPIFSIATAAKGQLDVTVQGNTATNIVTNGNFANGTTGWVGSDATLSAINNTLSITGSGTLATPRTHQLITLLANRKYYIRLKVRVTNASCTSINAYPNGGSTPANMSVTNPVQNNWYILSQVFVIGATNDNAIYITNNYADATTANGKVMEVKEVLAIDMGDSSANELYNLTATQMDTRFHWFDGTKSTLGERFTSTDNLLDPLKLNARVNTRFSVSGNTITLYQDAAWTSMDYEIIAPKSGTLFIKFRAKKLSGNSLIVSWGLLGNAVDILNTTLTSEQVVSTNVVVTANQKYYFTIFAGYDSTGSATISDLMISYNDIAYMKYASGGQVYTPAIGGSLPNGVKDEFIVSGKDAGKLTQNIQTKVLQASDITGMVTGTNVTYATILFSALTGYRTPSSNSDVNYMLQDYPNALWIDNVAMVNKSFIWTAGSFLGIVFAYGTSLATAQAALAGKTLTYQLATPVVTTVLVRIIENGVAAGSMMSLGNNTAVIQEPCVVLEAIPNASNQIILPITTPLTGLLACYKNTNTDANPMWVDALASASLVTATGVVTIAGADQTKKYMVAASADPAYSTLVTINESHPI